MEAKNKLVQQTVSGFSILVSL